MACRTTSYSSMDPLTLQRHARDEVPVHDGDDLVMISQIAAQATTVFIDDFAQRRRHWRSRRRADTSISNTARPCGSTRRRAQSGGDLASLSGVVVMAAVPEPSIWMMWLAGLSDRTLPGVEATVEPDRPAACRATGRRACHRIHGLDFPPAVHVTDSSDPGRLLPSLSNPYAHQAGDSASAARVRIVALDAGGRRCRCSPDRS